MITKLKFINGLKQNPIDKDFHITPCLTFSHEEYKSPKGFCFSPKGFCFALELGYWALACTIIFKCEAERN